MSTRYRRLFVWVEGEDDVRFFNKIIKPKLQKKYNFIQTILYATQKKGKIDDHLRSIKAMGADYIYVADIDNSPCVSAIKQETERKLRNIDKDKIIVVIKEIESWYLAGLSEIQSRKFKIRNFSATDTITKEQFYDLIPEQFNSRIDFMVELLKTFSVEVAKQRNGSFRYCIERYNCKDSENVGNDR
ncbi:MAG: hypothetical protein DDT41_01634 [candidate division WS2 bacterium]|nr:hypothetical protein [Candidatus Psychracetigena formicireducens]